MFDDDGSINHLCSLETRNMDSKSRGKSECQLLEIDQSNWVYYRYLPTHRLIFPS